MGWEWRCFLPLPSAVEVREVTVDERVEPFGAQELVSIPARDETKAELV